MPDNDHRYDPARPVYLRIGDWHASETSRNYSIGDTETGISVYDLAGDGSIVVPSEGEWSSVDLSQRLQSDEPRHLVQGEWVGCGGEGEPVLRNLVHVGFWPHDLPEGFKSSIVDFDDEILVPIEDAPERPRPEGDNHSGISP